MNAIFARFVTFLASIAAADCALPQASHAAGVDAQGHINLERRQPPGGALAGEQAESPQLGPAVVRREGAAAAALQAVEPASAAAAVRREAAPGQAAPQQDELLQQGSLGSHAEEKAEPAAPSWWSRWFSHTQWRDAGNSSAGLVEVEAKVDCQWGAWSSFTTCSHSCGGGTQSRSRSADVLAQRGGAPCEGRSVEVTPCSEDPCVEAGEGVSAVLLDINASGHKASATSDAEANRNYRKKCREYVANPPENHRLYSSQYNNDRWSMLNSHLAWTPKDNLLGQWMMIDLRTPRLISGIVTLGHPRVPWWVTTYRVAYQAVSKRGSGWAPVPGVFKGNGNQNGRAYVRFPEPVFARAIRISIEAFHGARPSMRAGLLVCKDKEANGPWVRAMKARVRRGERSRQRSERGRWKFDRKIATPYESKRGYAFAVAHHRLNRLRWKYRTMEARRQSNERYRRAKESQRERGERWRQNVYKAARRPDRDGYRKLVALEYRLIRADKHRNYAERERQDNEKRRIRTAKYRGKEVARSEKRSWALEKVRKAAEAERWKSEKGRRASAAKRVKKFKAVESSLGGMLSKLAIDETARQHREAGRDKMEEYRNKDDKEIPAKLMKDYYSIRGLERARERAEAKRKVSEELRQRVSKGELIDFDTAAKLALRKEADLVRRDKSRDKAAKAVELLLLRLGSRVNSTEHWRLVSELKRLHAEMLRLREGEDDDNALVTATGRAVKGDEDRKALERNRVKAWEDLLDRIGRAVSDATRLEGQARRAETNREAEEARRAKQAEAALKRLQAGEDQLTGDEAQMDKDDKDRDNAERRRGKSLEEAIGMLTNGQHWMKGLEVSRWKAEMKRQEEEQWRKQQAEAHEKFLKSLTGNATHDAILRRKHEAERAKAAKEREKKLKALGWDADSEESAARTDDSSRQHEGAERLGAEAQREREDEDEENKLLASLTRLERMELFRRRAERVRQENERKREDAEEKRLREIVKAATQPGPPGPPGHRGTPGDDTHGAPGDAGPPGAAASPPWERARAEAAQGGAAGKPVDCSTAQNDPYCGRRRRSSIVTTPEGE